jgi:hypothetical protein
MWMGMMIMKIYGKSLHCDADVAYVCIYMYVYIVICSW